MTSGDDAGAKQPAESSADGIKVASSTRNSVPAKRSKWDEDDDDTVDEERRQAVARAKAATRAARQRAKESQDQRRAAPDYDHREQSTSRAVVQEQPRPSTSRQDPVPRRSWYPPLQSCRSVYCYERLNHIEEGSYGVVFRARDKQTGEIVALKKLKMDREQNGFPITSLREIRTLMEAAHENVVRVREIVVGDTLTQ